MFMWLQAQRESLPTNLVRDELLRLYHSNQVIVVCGDTGCGKTTQLPQVIAAALVIAAAFVIAALFVSVDCLKYPSA
jgi:HrpA-like RNA helicase